MTHDLEKTNRMLALSNGAYDRWNQIITLGLPALGALYSGIAIIWSLPFGDQINLTLLTVVVFGKVALNISKREYKDSGAGTVGTISVDTVNPDKDTISLDMLKHSPLELAGMSEVTFKVENAPGNMDPRLIDNSR